MGVPIADPISGLFVTGMVLKVAADVGWGCVKDLVDLNVGDTTDRVAKITAPLQSPEGEIRSIHAIRARRLGPSVAVDLHMQVDPLLSVSGAQQAGQMVRSVIMKDLPEVNEVLLHIDVDEHSDPMDKSNTLRPINSIRADVKQILGEQPGIKAVSHVLIHYLQKQVLVEAQIIVDDGISVKEAKEIALRAKEAVESIKDVSEAHIDLELTHEHKFNTLTTKE